MTTELNRILCVEDEPDLQPVIRLALSRIGRFEVMICDDGEQAFAEGPEFAPDLIVLDVMMPAMDGPTVLARIRKIPDLAQVPVIFMTGKTNPEDVVYYRSLGAAGVIAKPFDVKGLASEVRRIWNAIERK